MNLSKRLEAGRGGAQRTVRWLAVCNDHHLNKCFYTDTFFYQKMFMRRGIELRDTISESSRSPLPPSPPTYMASASLGRPARPSSAARSGNSRSEGNWASTWPGAGAGVSACTGTGAGGKGVVAAPVQHCSTPAPWRATGRAWPCCPRPWETELLVDLVDILFLVAGVILHK